MCWNLRTNSESSSKLEEKEIERERIHSCVCVHKTNTDALFYARIRFIVVRILFLAACVRSSAGRLIPVVWSSEGFIYDCLQQTSEADTTVGSDLLGSESTQPSSSHFFRVCLFATMGRRRRRWWWRKKLDSSLTERARYSHTIYFFREEVICPYEA